MMSTAQALLQEIEEFLDRTGMKPTPFGKAACGDPHVVRWLRNGGGVSSTRIDEVKKFIREYKASGKSRPRFRGASAAA